MNMLKRRSKLRMRKEVSYSCAKPRPSAKVCGRSRRHRTRLLPRYQVYRMSREQMMALPLDILEQTIREFIEEFQQQLRVHEFVLKRSYRVEIERDFDIDYNVERFIFEQRLIPRR